MAAGVCLLIAPMLSIGEGCLTGLPLFVYGPNSSTEYPAFLGFLERVLQIASTGNSNVLLENFSAHMGNDCVT